MKKTLMSLVLLTASILLVVSCATSHVIIPEDPDLYTEGKSSLKDTELYITSFQVRNLTDKDLEEGAFLFPFDEDSWHQESPLRNDLMDQLINYIKSKNEFKMVVDATQGFIPPSHNNYMTLDVQLTPDHTEYRTYILDIVHWSTGGVIWPIAPVWGSVSVKLKANIHNSAGETLNGFSLEEKNSYFMMMWPYFNKKPIHEKVQESYTNLFNNFSQQINNKAKQFGGTVQRISVITSNETDQIEEPKKEMSEEEYRNRPLLSILDFQTENISEAEGQLLVDILSSALFNTGEFRILERAQRDRIIQEMDFSLSGCTDESCQIEIGKMLSADRLVVGSIGAISNRYIFNARLIDIETGETISTSSEVYKRFEDLIDDLDNIAQGLTN